MVLLAVVLLLSTVESIKLSIAYRDITYASLAVFTFVGVATDPNQLVLNPAQICYFFFFPIAMIIALQMNGKRETRGGVHSQRLSREYP